MNEMPLIVLRCVGRITGFWMTTTRAINADLPIVQAMLAAYHGAPDAYVYGPICVRARGCSFHTPGQPTVAVYSFKMGMKEVALFSINGFEYAVFLASGNLGEYVAN